MNKRNRDRLLSVAKVLDGWVQGIRRYVKAKTPKRERKPEPGP